VRHCLKTNGPVHEHPLYYVTSPHPKSIKYFSYSPSIAFRSRCCPSGGS
jgi:hypothetical protein